MHDLSQFRSQIDEFAARLATRGFTLDLPRFRELDAQRRTALTEAEQLKATRNAESLEISKLRKAGEDTTARQQKMRELGDRITGLDEQAGRVDEAFREILTGIPNVPHETAPVGASAEENVEVRRIGRPPHFDF